MASFVSYGGLLAGGGTPGLLPSSEEGVTASPQTFPHAAKAQKDATGKKVGIPNPAGIPSPRQLQQQQQAMQQQATGQQQLLQSTARRGLLVFATEQSTDRVCGVCV